MSTLSGPIDGALPAAVVAGLGLGDGPSTPLTGGGVSLVWRAVLDDGRSVALRRSPAFRTEAEVVWELDLRAIPGPLPDPDVLADLRRAFHMNALAGLVCALFDGPGSVPAITKITERLDREVWWGPMLASAARAVAGS